MEIKNETALLAWQALNQATVKGSEAKMVADALDELTNKLLEEGLLKKAKHGGNDGTEESTQ